jgi:hypothetical protein
MIYKDPIIERYLDLIKTNTSGKIKGFFNGMIGSIPASMLPAVILSIENTEVEELSNSEDEHRIHMVLNYIADIRPTLEDTTLITKMSDVLETLIGREVDYSLKENSILYILRNNLNIDDSNNLRTDVRSFSIVTPEEISAGRFPGSYSVEGTIRFLAHFYQER